MTPVQTSDDPFRWSAHKDLGYEILRSRKDFLKTYNRIAKYSPRLTALVAFVACIGRENRPLRQLDINKYTRIINSAQLQVFEYHTFKAKIIKTLYALGASLSALAKLDSNLPREMERFENDMPHRLKKMRENLIAIIVHRSLIYLSMPPISTSKIPPPIKKMTMKKPLVNNFSLKMPPSVACSEKEDQSTLPGQKLPSWAKWIPE